MLKYLSQRYVSQYCVDEDSYCRAVRIPKFNEVLKSTSSLERLLEVSISG